MPVGPALQLAVDGGPVVGRARPQRRASRSAARRAPPSAWVMRRSCDGGARAGVDREASASRDRGRGSPRPAPSTVGLRIAAIAISVRSSVSARVAGLRRARGRAAAIHDQRAAGRPRRTPSAPSKLDAVDRVRRHEHVAQPARRPTVRLLHAPGRPRTRPGRPGGRWSRAPRASTAARPAAVSMQTQDDAGRSTTRPSRSTTHLGDGRRRRRACARSAAGRAASAAAATGDASAARPRPGRAASERSFSPARRARRCGPRCATGSTRTDRSDRIRAG